MKSPQFTKSLLPVVLWSQLLFISFSCKDDTVKSQDAEFESVPVKVSITPGVINEASGLVNSRSMENYLWSHEDSGNPAEVFLIRKDGADIRKYALPGAQNRDWEDIAIGGGPANGVNYLYIADTGNNNANPSTSVFYIYRIPELNNTGESFRQENLQKISFRYPDGTPDAETLLLDPLTKDLLIVSKETDKSVLYRLPFPQSTTTVLTAERVGEVPQVIVATGGDISSDGSEVIIRNYVTLYYWKRKEGESLSQTLLRNASQTLPYVQEPQGEAVCFDKSASGYFTFSEIGFASSVTLNYFKRK